MDYVKSPLVSESIGVEFSKNYNYSFQGFTSSLITFSCGFPVILTSREPVLVRVTCQIPRIIISCPKLDLPLCSPMATKAAT